MERESETESIGAVRDLWNAGGISPLALSKVLVSTFVKLRQMDPAEIAYRLQQFAVGRRFETIHEIVQVAAGEVFFESQGSVNTLIDFLEEEDGFFEETRGRRGADISFGHPAFHSATGPDAFVDIRELNIGEGFDLRTLVPLSNLLSRQTAGLDRLLSLRLFGGLTLEQIAGRDGRPVAEVRRAWESVRALLTSSSPTETKTGDRRASLVSFGFGDGLLIRALCRHPELLRTLDWRSFERVVAEILEQLGFEIELRQGTKDGGVDVLAVRKDSVFGPHRYLVQVKRWAKRVGVAPVRELLFLHDYHRATKSCLATTSTFTSGAWQLGKEFRWKLELRDQDRLLEWIRLAAGVDE